MPLTDDPWLPTPDTDGNIPPIRPAAPVGVFRYDADAGTLTAMPNLECLEISRREGTDPGSAHFRYNLASGLDGAPVSIETALGTGSSGPYVVESGDRLVVVGVRPDASTEYLFDGLAIHFGMGLDPESEEVMIGAVGIAWRLWDDVIPGAILRNAASPTVVVDVPTDVPAQFNPQGQPNRTPTGANAGEMEDSLDFTYPTFLDPLVVQKPTDQRAFWNLNDAWRYLSYTLNEAETYVNNMDGAAVDALFLSPSDTGDTAAPIRCPDTPITGKDWPVTLNKLVAECGFGTSFDLTAAESDGLPLTTFNAFAQQGGPLKQLYLGTRGAPFSPTTFNFNASGLARDLADVVNQWTVLGGPDRYEATFILAPLFPMTAGDKSSLPSFDKGNPAYIDENRYAYRLFGLDECGEGYYAPGTTTQIKATSNALDGLLGFPDPDTFEPKYAQRRRVPLGQLVSIEPATGKPYEARLSVSLDYTGGGTITNPTPPTGDPPEDGPQPPPPATYGSKTKPGLWDGTGTWQPVTSTTWRLLSDRLGVEITDTNPNAWEVGKPPSSGMPFPSGVIHLVEALATTGATNLVFRLTCVVEADVALKAVAVPGGNSPLPQTIARVVDASDRYLRTYVDYPSEFNNAGGGMNRAVRDDSAAALAEAQAIRFGTESGVLEGPVEIPRLTTYYKVGDRIESIEGRGLGLRTDQGTGDPAYPVVVGVRHTLGPDRQSTAIELSDAGTDRTKYDRHPRRRAAVAAPAPAKMLRPGRSRSSDDPSPGLMMGGGGGGTGGPEPGTLMGGGSGGTASGTGGTA